MTPNQRRRRGRQAPSAGNRRQPLPADKGGVAMRIFPWSITLILRRTRTTWSVTVRVNLA